MKAFNDLKFVNCDNREKAVAHILNAWTSQAHSIVVNFIYYSNFITLHKNATYLDAMKLSDYILIDGIGMQLYFRIVSKVWPFNLNGTDLNPVLLKQLDEACIPIACYGTNQENIDKAVDNISAYLLNDSIYYHQNGFTPLNWEVIREDSVLMVGMGSPRQENWVTENIDIIRSKRLMVVTVGGFFDFASGFYVRAPKWVRAIKLEWAWRTMLHPKRHLQKRLNDLTIIFKPFIDRLTGQGRFLNISEIKD